MIRTITFDATVWLSGGVLQLVPRKIVLWSKHGDIRMLVLLFYLTILYIYIYKVECLIDKTTTGTAATVFLVPRRGRMKVVPAISRHTQGQEGET